MSSEAFLAALRRFIALRKLCTDIYSDCGTNLVSANKMCSPYAKQCAFAVSITYHFNPPAAPHFGGIWEPGIKAVKIHLTRVIGEQAFTYEEFYTVLCQIAPLLNFSSLSPLSFDANDLLALTPNHFLTSEPVMSFPDPDLTSEKIGHLNRWQLLQRLHQDFYQDGILGI